MVRVTDAKSDCSRRGKAEVRILNLKTTWSEFQKASQTATEQGKAKLRILKLASVFDHLSSVGPKQLCALAHLGCTCEAGTS